MYNAEVARRAKPCQGAAESGRLAPLCDTVGAVVVSCEGRCAAGVSSGGIALKRQGRVGEAAIHGAGCWAERWAGAGAASERCSVGVSTTGVGERVMVHALSRSAGARLRPREESGAAPTVGSCLAVLLRDTVCTDDSVRVEVGAAHSGQSMAIATLKGGSAAVADESTASFMINTSESIKEWSLGLSWPLHRPHA
ncbi:hypothetical protein QBZ16_001475 [Prototheca wickerhamii]|uniref:Uncharacterized protein n=1 Tax=Prototheca wickerhamii TaxID=3111 RepID=A0AAD9MFY7_PROWI|nr:hypothetical protein QBZ16_001475 [Prototheca wickerhamii]